MTCFHPLLAYKITDKFGHVKVKVLGKARSQDDLDFHKNLETAFVWKHLMQHPSDFVEPLLLSCGKCIGCRLASSRNWAIRCIHEAQMWPKNAFITLTYDDVYLPYAMSFVPTLIKEDLQKFWKRLRKSLGYKIRYFACGEYGSELSRPHFHACVFNYWPDDAKLWSIRNGVKLYVSPSLAKIWPYGFHTIGEVTFDSAAYVARYVLKKINGDAAPNHYQGRNPEFVVMSRRPGIGHDWLIKYHEDVYGDDCTIPDRIVVKDKFVMKPPKYYDHIYDVELDGDLEYLKNIRADRSFKEFTFDELKRKELYKELDLKKNTKRDYEGI